jgi:hypothetical protein
VCTPKSTAPSCASSGSTVGFITSPPDLCIDGENRAHVSRRAGLAMALGVRYLQVDASNASRSNLEQLALTAVATTTPNV